MRVLAKSIIPLLSATSALVCGAEDFPAGQGETVLAAKSGRNVTNVAEFRAVSGPDYLAGCGFHLTGVITLVDSNRNLVVLQDATGAVALNFRIEDQTPQVGQLVTLDGSNCCPYFASFPDYPYHPSGRDIRSSFESPGDWGEYNLTRMRGYLHPQTTGEYRFWIASDNSSELWLSMNADPSNAHRIAYIPRFSFVNPHEWSKFPSQSSEPIYLKAGETYYIEAMQEQTTLAENLSGAWQGPGLNRAVIDGRYLTPWNDGGRPDGAATNGILREYWTNYTIGSVDGMVGARPYESLLTVKTVRMHLHGPTGLPIPYKIDLNRPLLSENNYRWVQVEGVMNFKSTGGDTLFLELSHGHAIVQVRALHLSPEISGCASNVDVRVEGVCEGVYDQTETLTPGLIWASTENSVSFIKAGKTNAAVLAGDQPAPLAVTSAPVVRGFFGTRGVVTFNDRVFDEDYIFIQENNYTMRVSSEYSLLKSQLKVGEKIDLGGFLELGKSLPVISPLFVTQLGLCSMPFPITQQPDIPIPPGLDGKWSEFAGVVHSVNTNGTLSLMGSNGPVYLWVGQTSSNHLARYVDAKLRARGVLMLNMLDAPVLLIPSRDFVDVEEEPPQDPFGIGRRFIRDILSEGMESSWEHRARVIGEITYRDAQSFFIQDATGGIQVQLADKTAVNVGETVDVLAFPALNGGARSLIKPLMRPAKPVEQVKPEHLDLSGALSSRQGGTLVYVTATLLARKTNRMDQVLELQEQQRIFSASLATGQEILPDLVPGSRLKVTGVYNEEPVASPPAGEKSSRAQSRNSFNILLRSPQDVVMLSGPPWWTLRKTASLAGMLLTILVIALSWVHLLHRRIERQRAAQLAFSRHVLERLENERRRIAVNLHDSLGQILMVIKNHAILAIQRPPEEQGLTSRLDEISGATSKAIEEVRRITHGLRPYQLDRLGLTQAIRTSVNQASENGLILFATRVNDIDNLFDNDAEIHVYRIVQEAVTNVVKHSAATEAAVVIKKRTTIVSLSVRDNGRGFNPSEPSTRPHDLGYGLSGIAERVRILGGTLAIVSQPGKGTSLTVEVPIPILKL